MFSEIEKLKFERLLKIFKNEFKKFENIKECPFCGKQHINDDIFCCVSCKNMLLKKGY